LIAVFCVIALAQEIRPRPPGIAANWRLIQTAENETKWMAPEEIEKLDECGKNAQHHGGFFDITDFPLLGKLEVPQADPLPTDCRYDTATVAPFLNAIQIQNWIDTVTDLSALATRYYTSQLGVQGAEYLYNTMTKLCGSKCKVEYFRHSWVQPSVIVTIPGKTNDVIIVGAHQDSTASPSVNNAPGADDDASGCGAIMEMARVLLQGNYTNHRNIQFQFYAAEEAGLLGSQAIAQKYAADGVDVFAMLQFDMVGYVSNGRPPVFITDFVSAPLTSCLRTVSVQLGHTWGQGTCGYACSDHASWTRAGYRSSFPFEQEMSFTNRAIHTVNDKIDLLSPAHAKLFIELGVASIIRLDSPSK